MSGQVSFSLLLLIETINCIVRYESFSYLSDELEFSWIENESTVNMNISLAQFDVQTSLVARLS